MSGLSLDTYLTARADDPAIHLMTQTKAAMRADAGYLARDTDAAAAVFLSEEAPASLDDDALDRVLARIEAAEAADRRAVRAAGDDPVRGEIAALPSPLREAALEALRRDHWRVNPFGLWRLPLDLGATHCELMRVEPGVGVPQHDHLGDELTLILTGAYHDGHADYGPGDVSLARPGFAHAPKAKPGEVCYVLAVSFGDPRFTGLVGLFQRLTGYPRTPRPSRPG
jgi:putative transcriptional regulator